MSTRAEVKEATREGGDLLATLVVFQVEHIREQLVPRLTSVAGWLDEKERG